MAIPNASGSLDPATVLMYAASTLRTCSMLVEAHPKLVTHFREQAEAYERAVPKWANLCEGLTTPKDKLGRAPRRPNCGRHETGREDN